MSVVYVALAEVPFGDNRASRYNVYSSNQVYSSNEELTRRLHDLGANSLEGDCCGRVSDLSHGFNRIDAT